jgi:hypothetical protein
MGFSLEGLNPAWQKADLQLRNWLRELTQKVVLFLKIAFFEKNML